MSPTLIEEAWDLTPVIDLVHSLSIRSEHCSDTGLIEGSSSSVPSGSPDPAFATEDGSEQVDYLGNFDKIWQYFGQSIELQQSNDLPEPAKSEVKFLENDGGDCTTPKAVKWRDELEGADLADNDEDVDPQSLSNLTKSQRKKARKKQKRRDQKEAGLEGIPVFNGSEDEKGKEIEPLQTPDRKAIILDYLRGNTTPQSTTSALRSGKFYKAEAPDDPEYRPPAKSQVAAQEVVRILRPRKDSSFAIAAARKAKLIAMLTETFVDERQFLSNISYIQHVSLSTEVPAEGIHVFVDASNVSPQYPFVLLYTDKSEQIMIGFHDALKLARGQARHHRIPRQPLSFHNFSLVLERGRPTAKRIIVGSDNFPYIAEAKVIGYETNILDRVHKAKELTPRQIKFANHGNGTGTGTGSGSETTAAAAAQYAPEKWVEQAVDEILHLKMMESIVDASEPSIMVLATGDAAEAEYSDGFLKMVERALGKGWKVELACFKHNMSGAYNRRDFRQRWGERFKIVELDEFVEVLQGSE